MPGEGAGPAPGVQLLPTARGTFGVLAAGPHGGRPVLLLHGFPDDLTTFGALQAALARAGRRSVAVALRGYAPSPLTGPYDLRSMAADLLAVLDALPGGPAGLAADIVGHDYGGQVVYAALQRSPERFGRAVTLAAPHPDAIARNARRSVRQVWRSRYVIGFQVPRVAEWRVRRRSFRLVERCWRRWGAPGWTPPADHLQRVRATMAASMPAPVAAYRGGGFTLPGERIRVPVHAVLGAADGCVLPGMADGQEDLFEVACARTVLPGTGHFAHWEAPEEVTRLVVEELAWTGRVDG